MTKRPGIGALRMEMASFFEERKKDIMDSLTFFYFRKNVTPNNH